MHNAHTGFDGAVQPCQSARIQNYLVVSAYAVYTFCSMFQYMTLKLQDLAIFGGVLAKFYEPLTCLVLILVIILRKWRWGLLGLLGLAALAGVYFFSESLSNVRTPTITLLFLLAIGELDGDGLDYLTLVKVSFWTSAGILTICLIATTVFSAPEWWDVLDGGYVSGRGVSHPNAYSILVFNATLCIALLLDRKRFFIPIVMCVGFSTAFVYWIQRSDTTAMLLVLLLAILVLEHWRPRLCALFSKPIVFFVSLSIIACAIASFMLFAAMAYSSENGVLTALDRLLHGRISMPSAVLHEYGGYPVFGKPLDALTGRTGSMHAWRMLGVPLVMLDCSYTRYALISGLTLVVCTMALFLRSVSNIGQQNPSFFLWGVFLIMLAYMIMECYPSFLSFNCTLPLLAYGLIPKRDIEGFRITKDFKAHGEE